MKTTSRIAPFLAALVLAVAGCGSDSGSNADAPDFESALAAAPPELAALYEQGDEILEGGEPALGEQLADLEGYPVVVNVWASWCVPCRAEFPYLQSQAAATGTEVGYLGILTEDSIEAGETFLEDNPLPYPSFHDPEGELAELSGNPGTAYPSTSFYDAEGRLLHTKFGGYADEAELAADIEKYALGRG